MKILKIGLKRIRNGGGRATCSPFLICLTSMAGLDELLSKPWSTLGLKKKSSRTKWDICEKLRAFVHLIPTIVCVFIRGLPKINV